MTIPPQPITVCELEDGKRLQYDGASLKRNPAVYKGWQYLGKGKVFSVDGVRQAGIEMLHFFKEASRKREKMDG